MQVRDITECQWIPVSIWCRNTPIYVNLITCVNGKWSAEPVLLRGTDVVEIFLPVCKEDA